MNEGRKDDQAKLRWDLLPPDALEEIVKVLTFGANKYNDRNWERGMRWGRVFRALIGHCWSWWRGHPADEETGLSHMAHAGCCVLFLLSYELRKIGTDDRLVETPYARPDTSEPSAAVHTGPRTSHV